MAIGIRPLLVHYDTDGTLVYECEQHGHRISDFSFAGYGGGGVPLPTVTTVGAWLESVDRGGVGWQEGDVAIAFNRYVLAKEGNTITIDAPVFTDLTRSLSPCYAFRRVSAFTFFKNVFICS